MKPHPKFDLEHLGAFVPLAIAFGSFALLFTSIVHYWHVMGP